MARTCPSCSTQNIDGARFCRTCGTVLQPSSPTPPRSVVDSTPYQPNYPSPYQSPNQYPNANPTSTISPISTAPNYGAPFQQSYNPMFGSVQAVPYAGFGSRLLAHIIDNIVPTILLAPSYLYLVSQNSRHGDPDPIALAVFMLCLLLVFIYWLVNIFLLGKNGATIGKSMMGLKCLGPDGQPLGFGKAFLRELVRHVIGFCGILSLIDHLSMNWDLEKQTWHDKVISSHVFKI